MDRFVTDDFYDGEDGESCGSYNDNPDDWVLTGILDRRGNEGARRYLCTWDGYEEKTWEPTARLASLGYLSRSKEYDAKKAADEARLAAAAPAAVPRAPETPLQKAHTEQLMRSNVFVGTVARAAELVDPKGDIPRPLSLTFTNMSPPPTYTETELKALRESYLRTSHEPLPEGMEQTLRAQFRFTCTSWDPSCSVRSPVGPAGVFRVSHTAPTAAAVVRIRDFVTVYHNTVNHTPMNISSRKTLVEIMHCRKYSDLGLSAHQVEQVYGRNSGRAMRGIPPVDMIHAWSASLHGSHELWYPDGRRYRGAVADNVPHGRGVMLLPEDAGKVTGQWHQGQPCDIAVDFPSGLTMTVQAPFCSGAPTTAFTFRANGMTIHASASKSRGVLAALSLQHPFFPPVLVPNTLTIQRVGDSKKVIKSQPSLNMARVIEVMLEGRLAVDDFVLFIDREFAQQRQQRVAAHALTSGTLTFSNGTYVGSFLAGTSLRQGQGKYTWESGQTYEGTWDDNTMHGQGTYRWLDGRCYTGAFCRDALHGRGCYDFGDGSRFEGEFKEDMISGHGLYVSDSGREVAVEWTGVDPLDAIFMATPAFDKAAVDAAEAEARAQHRHRPREDPRTAAIAVPSHLPPASLLSDEGVEPHCVICRDERKTRAVVPCGHLCVCDECSSTGKVTQCPLCRVPVEMLMQLYM